MSETITPKDAQKARITYLLGIAGAEAGLAGWTPTVISLLAPAFQKAMEDEGVYLEYRTVLNDKVAALEPKVSG